GARRGSNEPLRGTRTAFAVAGRATRASDRRKPIASWAMATIVSFHAHPDDEAIGTGGTLAKAAAEGHRVVIVWATRGEHGEVDDGFLAPGEALWERRIEEAAAAAEILGAARTEFLGYVDSGMMGTAEND